MEKKLEFNLRSPIPESDSRLNYPGLYSETNPLGYYSYRIVVKQQEQEYYNVYTPGALAGELIWDVSTDATNTVPDRLLQLPSFHSANRITLLNLFGDNVNKVPRELEEVNGNDTTFSSRVLLYNRVNPRPSTSQQYNTQSNVSKQGEKVVSIEPFKELGAWTRTKGNLFPAGNENLSNTNPQPWYPYYPDSNNNVYNFHDIFFNAQANPFIAKIETDFQIGATPTYGSKAGIENSWQDLGVFETAPTESVLDIYFESSTSGLITDFNLAASDAVPAGISDGTNSTVLGQNIQYIHTEGLDSSIASPKDATLSLQLTDSAGGVINSSFTAQILQVLDGNGNNRNSDFTITQPTTSTFKIQSTSKQVFLSDSSVRENYTFNLMFTDTSNPSNPLWTGPFPLQLNNCQLQNVAPAFTTQPTPIATDTYEKYVTSGNNGQGLDIFSVVTGTVTRTGDAKAVNGSANTSRNTEELVYEVVDAAGYSNYNGGANDFEINFNGTDKHQLNTIENFFTTYPPTQVSDPGSPVNVAVAEYNYYLQLKATDANGNGDSVLSTAFKVKIIVSG